MVGLLAIACSGGGGADATTSTAAAPAGSAAPPVTGIADTTRPPPPTGSTATTASPTTTTTTTQPRTTTTRPPASSAPVTTAPRQAPTTSRAPAGNNSPPTVVISSPASAIRYQATYDPNEGRFGASVPLSATAMDADGDEVEISWFSSDEGFLGTGASITVRLHPRGDASQPTITAVATDSRGATAEDSRQVIVWIVSDQ